MMKLFTVVLLLFIGFLHAEKHTPEMNVQMGHSFVFINTIAVSPDGKFLASGSENILLWDVKSGKEVRRINGHESVINSLVFSPDGTMLLSCSSDMTIKLWNIETGKQVRSFEGHRTQVKSIAFSPDGKSFVSVSLSGMRLWNINSGEMIHSFDDHNGSYDVAFSPDGKYIVSGVGVDSENRIELWDAETFKSLKYFDGHKSIIYCLSFSPDGKYVLSGSEDKTLKLWNVKTGKKVRTFSGMLSGHKEEVKCADFSPDGKFIVSGSYDETVKVWKTDSGDNIGTYNVHSHGVTSIASSPDGVHIFSCCLNKSIIEWDVRTGKVVKVFKGYTTEQNCSVVHENGSYILTGNEANSLKLWDISNIKELRTFSGHENRVFCVDYSSDGKYAASGSYDQNLILWDINSGKEIRRFKSYDTPINSLKFSPDSKYLMAGYSKGFIKLWNVGTGEEVSTFNGHTQNVSSIDFSKDGKRAVSGSRDNTVKLWNVSEGKEIFTLKGHGDLTSKYLRGIIRGTISAVLLANEDNNIISAGDDKNIIVWDANTGKEVRRFSGHEGPVTAVSVSKNSEKLLSGSSLGIIKLWDIRSGEEIRSYHGHTSIVESVGFLADGKKFMSSSVDGTIRIWDIESGDYVAFMSHQNNIDWVIFTQDGYWDSSQKGGELVSMSKGLECWNIDQFAVRNNRPDIILQRLGSNDADQIARYYNQYKKRLRKLGLTEEIIQEDYNVPVSQIRTAEVTGKFVDMKFELSDAKHQLLSYNVYVNDVPVYGSIGKNINGNSIELTEKVELTNGQNKIEISCVNEKGAESYRDLVYATYENPLKPDLYYIGFGVSDYKDTGLNLKYAHKDAVDLAVEYKKRKDNFNKIYTYTFTNGQVTVENIKKAKDLLKNSKPDDVLILFIAGHGIHDIDADATYYYLTHETDVNNLKDTAADFDFIEDILQGVPPRNKLFLMDTCESGEIDNDMKEQVTYFESDGIKARSIKNRGIRLNTNQTSIPKSTFLHERNRYIYNDLARRSGAIVFSSSKGGEYSYEDDKKENGFFTYKIKELLNIEKLIPIDKLEEEVKKGVSELSKGMQNPTIDRDNIFIKFGI